MASTLKSILRNLKNTKAVHTCSDWELELIILMLSNNYASYDNNTHGAKAFKEVQ